MKTLEQRLEKQIPSTRSKPTRCTAWYYRETGELIKISTENPNPMNPDIISVELRFENQNSCVLPKLRYPDKTPMTPEIEMVLEQIREYREQKGFNTLKKTKKPEGAVKVCKDPYFFHRNPHRRGEPY